ncbi:amidohydrolase family protein, partial [Candidatus Bathyarchaeota archaeon]|nr:amidohydrolase family protein [Candidatus Bathyarchaeota archaeon]
VDKYPDKFRACCSDQTLQIKVARGEAEWTMEAALEEVESALKTGKYVGIGEFVPRNRNPEYTYIFRERLDEWRKLMDLAAKYNVVIHFHEWSGSQWGGGPYAGYALLSRVASEYPKVNIINNHGGWATSPERLRLACKMGESAPFGRENVYMECGGWPAEYFEIALKDPNVGVTQIIWGHDYCEHQYVFSRKLQTETGVLPRTIVGHFRKMPDPPTYHPDYWGWHLHEIDRIRKWVTQDEINLILGGNAAKIYKLPVPHPRMFPSGRPDIWGIHWKKSVPFLPADQIQNPDTPQPYPWDNLD